MRSEATNPQDSLMRSPKEIAAAVEIFRLELYNRGDPCGARAIRQRLDEERVRLLPSLSTINRILARRGLTCGRTGIYKGEPNPPWWARPGARWS